ncbi:MAG TPA: ferrous iron transport protein B, partial [Terriglobales bacterium]|nr:ferrous iron transport protein B [Terriglobales bacterium]
ALTGLTQHTGNYAGVTVESALGTFHIDGAQFEAVDLPGSYSLAPRAPDEMVAVRVLLGRGAPGTRPDVILCVVDASNLERNLYLLTQVLELGLPVVVALTMVDVAGRNGISIDLPGLRRRLGVPILPVQATRRAGLEDLRRALLATARAAVPPGRKVHMPALMDGELSALDKRLRTTSPEGAPAFVLERLLIDSNGFIEQELAGELGASLGAYLQEARQRVAADRSLPQLEVEARYRWIGAVVAATVRHVPTRRHSWTDNIDAVVTHKVWGTLIFLLAMAVTFQAIFSWSVPLMEAIEGLFSFAGAGVAMVVPPGPLRSLLLDGVIGGVGAVITFVPQIAVLFALITILEDSGYMARAAFLMDRVMSGFQLSGRSFIPLLSSFACAVPGVMSARAIENRRDRIATILIAPLMSCSARLPVYVLFIAAFVPDYRLAGVLGLQGLTLFAMYMLGLLIAPPIALLLKRTVLKGPPVPFLLELPPYKVPSWRVVLFRMYDRSLAFIRRAGSIILATGILVWALSYYPNPPAPAGIDRNALTGSEIAALEEQQAGERLRHSYLGQAGQWIEPVVRPLGWDWKIGMAVLASFPAREVVIAALGTIYNIGGGEEAQEAQLREVLRAQRRPDGSPIYTAAVALSIMVFFALCCQCAATLATIWRETGSWKYPLFTFTYMTAVAYLAALAVYQIGSRLVPS